MTKTIGGKNMFTLYTDTSSLDLYAGEKSFFAEDQPLVGEQYLVEILVEPSVKLQLRYETDGVKIYEVHPYQVVEVL